MIESKISVVTVVYNRKKELEETVLSIIEQNYPIEYIVIDGGSTDGTLDVLQKYNDSITCWISEPDNGIFDAINKSLDYVSGDYVNFMNAGDCFVNNHVISDIFSGKIYEDDIIYGDCYIRNELGYLFARAKAIYERNPTKNDLVYKGQGICHQSIFTKRIMLKKIRFNLLYPLGADYDTTSKVFYLGNHKIRYVGFPISIFDDRNGGASHNNIIRVYKERLLMFNCKKDCRYYFFINKLLIENFVKSIILFLFPSFVYKMREKKYIQNIE